jgi:hypothetical protein
MSERISISNEDLNARKRRKQDENYKSTDFFGALLKQVGHNETGVSDGEKQAILSKVRDIDQDTAFTITDGGNIDVEILRSVFKSGVLGTAVNSPSIGGLVNSPNIWRERIRQEQMPLVHFQISGSHHQIYNPLIPKNRGRVVDNWYSGSGTGLSKNQIGFTFDISRYKEGSQVSKQDEELVANLHGQPHTYYRETSGDFLMASRVPPET